MTEPPALNAPTPPLERRTVLAVDDDRALLQVLVRTLQQDDFHAISASSGEEALQHLEQSGLAPHLLITDYVMPGIDGRELAPRVRQRVPNVKVLYQTAFSPRLMAGREPETNSAYIQKPFSASALIDAARGLLGV